MKKIILLVVALILAMMMPLSCMGVSAQKTDVTYEENFEYGDTDITPTVNCGGVEIVEEEGNHFLTFLPNKDGYSLSPFGPYVADYDFSVRVRQDTRGRQTHVSKILVHSEWGEASTYQINLYNYRITATYEHYQEKVTLAEKTGIEFNDNVWYTLQIFSRGDTCTVCIDGKKLLTFTADTRPEGCFGFVTWQTELAVDDISITEYLDGTAPAVETLIPEEEESDDRKVIESERPTRKMKDNIIKVSKVISESGSLKTVISVVSFTVAIVALALLIVLVIIELKKKKQKE